MTGGEIDLHPSPLHRPPRGCPSYSGDRGPSLPGLLPPATGDPLLLPVPTPQPGAEGPPAPLAPLDMTEEPEEVPAAGWPVRTGRERGHKGRTLERPQSVPPIGESTSPGVAPAPYRPSCGPPWPLHGPSRGDREPSRRRRAPTPRGRYIPGYIVGKGKEGKIPEGASSVLTPSGGSAWKSNPPSPYEGLHRF